MKHFGFLFDIDRCINCAACQVACKEEHGLGAGLFFRRTALIHTPNGARPFSLSCAHCETCAAAKVCPADAFVKAADGSMQLQRELCIGCGLCQAACPYGAIACFKDAKAAKCDACSQRRSEGKEPACISACRTGALTLLPPEETTESLISLPDPSCTAPAMYIRSKTSLSPETVDLFYVNPTNPINKKEDN